ncbi:winged helix-turn-helix transcriptional regulator [Candidatus Bathyarchaeota archaeon]|nr:winged helix-turn-helix transcriptional regulator [Candidatus Bathyarchaeota archaeon]
MKDTDKETKELLKKSPTQIAEYFKAVAHTGRVTLLTALLDGEKALAELVEASGLSRNASVNHLDQLMASRLVERTERGRYVITVDGRDVITSAAMIYRESTVRERRQREARNRAYTEGWRRVREEVKIIDNPAKYEKSWFSYPGAVTGVLKSVGVDVDLTDVIAVSGYGWVTNAMRGSLCPSAPSAFHCDVWMEIYEATTDLGYRVEPFNIMDGFTWEGERKPTPESVVNARRQFDVVKKEIDAGRPAVVWGLVIPEYGIVNGYSGEDYIVSTYRSLIGQPDDPVHYTGLMAPGGLIALKFTEPVEKHPAAVAADTLRRGYRLAMGHVQKVPEYAIGLEGYDVLASNLVDERHDENSYHGFAYTVACLQESKRAASDYLRRVDMLLEPDLSGTAANYSKVHELIKECHEMFPYSFKGELEKPKCVRAAELLREAKETESAALEKLGKALDRL